MDSNEVLELTQVGTQGGLLETSVTLANPSTHLRLRLPEGNPGRAEVLFQTRSWAAKHYWREADGVTVYQFDEPLPAGPIRVRVPLPG